MSKVPVKADKFWKCNKCGHLPDEDTKPKMLMGGKCPICFLGDEELKNG